MRLTVREIAIFAMLGAVMFASKLLMEFAPNIHLLGTFTVAFTVVYRRKALYPIYTYVLLNGLFYGFAAWWIPYLYVWTILWGAVMLLPKKMPKKIQPIVYMLVCAMHGFLFGPLYAPAQALLYGIMCNARIFIWNIVCSGAGHIVWHEFKNNDCMDYCRSAVGLYTWYQ